MAQELDAVHFGLCAASAVIPAPSSPDGPTEAFRCPQDLVTGDRPGGIRLPGLRVLAGWYDRVGTAGRNGLVAFTGVEGAISGDAGDLLIGWNLVEQFGQHRRCGFQNYRTAITLNPGQPFQ